LTECEDDLDILTALIEESEGIGGEQADDLDGLFDEDNDEYKDGIEETEDTVSDLFGDVDDIENEESNTQGKEGAEEVSETLNKSKEDLQEELRQMQEKMKQLQQQLDLSQKASTSSPTPAKTTESTKGLKTTPPRQPTSKLNPLNNADSFKRKPRVAHQPKPKSTSRSPPASQSRPRPGSSGGQPKPLSLPPLPKDVAVEKYSRLRLRKPRVSSIEMDHKMGGRRLIRLSELPERLAREKLEDSDWVTFAVLINKATPQSNSSGKTFSIWKLNDLHNLEVCVSLLLFGEVHKEHWKTEPGTVIGLLNPNPMKQKEGYDGVSLTVDHPQKVLLMGEAQDYGTCKAMKKNGEPCSQIVNMYECQYCQYHVKAQYKKMSSKRAELQSSFSGKAPNRVKGKGGNLRERLCQDGFYYGGVSSAACAASLSPPAPHIGVLFCFFLAMQSGKVSGCSDDFKSLMLMPTPGALQLKKHLAQGKQSDGSGASIQSISASDLLKQQKQKQQELLENRRRRAETIQNKVLQSSSGARPGLSLPRRDGMMSPKAASDVPKTTQSPATPTGPTLGRGFSEGEDILFFDNSPPQVPASSSHSLSAAKMAALKKLRAKGAGLQKEDPNAVKRKRSNGSEINARVEKNLVSHNVLTCAGESGSNDDEEEPAQKKKRDQLKYIQSEEFQKILNLHLPTSNMFFLQERYFDALVKKEQMEEKMKGIREMKCRAVSCKKCNYTYFKPADRCVGENHDLRWHDAVKRFFKCPCGQRAIVPTLHGICTHHNCGLFKWERDGMMKEKTGPKIGGELLLPRGEEHGKFLNSMK
uniref:Protein MCM10 homolog n=1 Tax=Sphaeramia orbicularis TaxID=375764 RepID=A0A673B2U3_9TELE